MAPPSPGTTPGCSRRRTRSASWGSAARPWARDSTPNRSTPASWCGTCGRSPAWSSRTAAGFSAALRTYALDLSRIANDIRLLASGPRTGLAEIRLPAVQPGSSIMPGKVNPSIAEMVNMVCFQAVGNDTTVAFAAEAGQLELNVMMPVLAHNLLFSMMLLTGASEVFARRCIQGIQADPDQCAHWLDRSPALITALAPQIGYAEAARLAKEAVDRGLTVRQLLEEKRLLPPGELARVLDLRAMTEVGIPGKRS
jgi:aspartate ammonia-lyase